MTDPEDPEDRDPGLARERTALAWTRTAISFAAVGGVVLKTQPVPGLVIMCAAPAIWQLGRLARRRDRPAPRPENHQDNRPDRRLKLVTATIVAVALVALVVALR